MGHKRRAKRVDRAERVLPPPEAAQHRRLWPMQTLLHIGPPDGIDAGEFEAALQIVETWHVLVRDREMLTPSPERLMLGHAGFSSPSMSDRDAERVVCWFEWSAHLPLGLPPRLVAWIEDEQPIGSVEVLRRALRMWDRVRADRAKLPVAGVDTEPPYVLTMPATNLWGNPNIAARPSNRPVQAICPSPATLPPTMQALPTGCQMRQGGPRPVAGLAHAHTTADPSPRRLRR